MIPFVFGTVGETTLVNVTAEMLEPITESIKFNVLLPVGIAIMAVMIGVALIGNNL